MEKRTEIELETEKVLMEHYDSYYRLAYSYMKNKEDALDVVQESAYKAMRDCNSVRESAFLKTWMYRIVVNTALDFLRKKKHEEVVETLPEDGREDVYEDWDLQMVLNRLGEKEKSIIVLRYFEEEKLEDIAKILGENLSTVKARLYRTLKKLRIELETESLHERGNMA
ncbi:MAG: sigma-70 family RNA polymerase sigma factor [bacterium]|nr:sigma-70 family RNA polymerase sigma factor [bacterium]